MEYCTPSTQLWRGGGGREREREREREINIKKTGHLYQFHHYCGFSVPPPPTSTSLSVALLAHSPWTPLSIVGQEALQETLECYSGHINRHQGQTWSPLSPNKHASCVCVCACVCSHTVGACIIHNCNIVYVLLCTFHNNYYVYDNCDEIPCHNHNNYSSPMQWCENAS